MKASRLLLIVCCLVAFAFVSISGFALSDGIGKVAYGNKGSIGYENENNNVQPSYKRSLVITKHDNENSNIQSRPKRDLTKIKMSSFATHGKLNGIAPFAKFVTTRIISLIKNLESFNDTEEIPIERMEKFMKRSTDLLDKGRTTMPDGLWGAAETAVVPDLKSIRYYTSDEVIKLRELKNSIIDILRRGMRFINGVNSQVRVFHGCTNLRGNSSHNDVVVSAEVNLTVNLKNILLFMCKNEGKMNSLSSLIDLLDMQIDKEAPTNADFYLIAFSRLKSGIEASSDLDTRAIPLDPFSYHHPFVGGPEN